MKPAGGAIGAPEMWEAWMSRWDAGGEPTPPDIDEHRRREHRARVVRRLLTRGMEPDTLATILPDWGPVIAQVRVLPATEEAHAPPGQDR